MLLVELVATSREVAETSSRLAKVGALASCLRRLSPEEIETGVAFLSCETRQGRLGVGYAAIRDSVPAAGHFPSLTLTEVDREFDRIQATSGPGATQEKKRVLAALLARATREEQDFLVRLVLGELRQGALKGLMTEAIAQAAGIPDAAVRKAAMLSGSLAEVARTVLTEGLPGLARFSMQLFRPVLPMLARPAQDMRDALGQLGTVSLEWKLDGARVQVHKAGDDVRVFTRSLNDVTTAVPEIVENMRSLPVSELILDGEAIALRPDGAPQPFQVTMRRFGRKLDVAGMRESLPLSVFFFDCLRLGTENYLDRPALERFDALARSLPAALLIPRLVTADPEAAEAFFDDALRRGHEGVMAKSLAAPYEAGSRGSAWLKVKRANTLDLVVLAAEWGHGRRSGWLSNLHLGARDPATGEYVMLGKTFKGLTDAMLAWQTERLLALEISRDAHTVYVRPELVAEIAFNELQASSQYPGGLALRFARVKSYRTDKRPEQADTIDAVRAIFSRQSGAP
jgi:DNA ligase 1